MSPATIKRFWSRLEKFAASNRKCSKCGSLKSIKNFSTRLANDSRKTHAIFYKGKWYTERRAECNDCWNLTKCREHEAFKRLWSRP